MRIIYVTASLPYGSQEAFIIAEINALVELGHDVLVVPRSPRGPLLHAGELKAKSRNESLFSANVVRDALRLLISRPVAAIAASCAARKSRSLAVAAKNLAVLPKALWLAQLAKAWGADHIHCHWAATTATMAMIASELCEVPWSVTAHRWDIVERNLLTKKAERAAFVRVISDGSVQMMAENGVTDHDKLFVVRMGVKMPALFERRPSPPPVLLCPANLVEVKGHRFLLEAWQILKERGVEGELWLAGQGELEQPLRTLIHTLHLEPSVKLLGVLPHTSLLHLYETGGVSAVVLASIDMGNGCHEGIPVALVEAMSYGIPVISTSTGSIPELILPGTGILVPPRESQALADGMQMLLEDKSKAQEMGWRGRLRVKELHDIRGIAASLESRFRSATLTGHLA